MLAGNVANHGHVHTLGDFLELLHALYVNVSVFGIVREVAGE